MKDTGIREWSDRRAQQLYSLAIGSRDRRIRQEALHFLGALQRAGCDDAAWAIKTLKGRGKAGGPGPLP